jgi:hypothetical protein
MSRIGVRISPTGQEMLVEHVPRITLHFVLGYFPLFLRESMK